MTMSPLIAAAEADFETFKAIYETGHPYTNPKDPAFFSYAIQNPNPTARRQVFDYLVTRGLNPHTRDKPGNLLHGFAAGIHPDNPDDLDFFHHLLTLGLDPNETTRRYGTPADILIGQYRYTDTQLLPYIQLLLDHGFDPTQPGRDGYTALQYSKKTDGSRDHIHTLLLNHAHGT